MGTINKINIKDYVIIFLNGAITLYARSRIKTFYRTYMFKKLREMCPKIIQLLYYFTLLGLFLK